MQQVFGLMIVVLSLAGCVEPEPAVLPTGTLRPTDPPPPTAVPPTDTPLPTESGPLPTATFAVDTSVPLEQAIVGVWVNSPEDVHNRRYHVYTEDGKFCFGNYLPPLLEGNPANCKNYEVDGNVVSEICAKDSFGCTAGDVCKAEVHIMDNGWLHYYIPEACPAYPAGHPVIGDPEIFFEPAEEG
jgi:hypothetical protein